MCPKAISCQNNFLFFSVSIRSRSNRLNFFLYSCILNVLLNDSLILRSFSFIIKLLFLLFLSVKLCPFFVKFLMISWILSQIFLFFYLFLNLVFNFLLLFLKCFFFFFLLMKPLFVIALKMAFRVHHHF